MNLAVGGSDSEERALVGAVIRLVGRHTIAIHELPVDHPSQIDRRLLIGGRECLQLLRRHCCGGRRL